MRHSFERSIFHDGGNVPLVSEKQEDGSFKVHVEGLPKLCSTDPDETTAIQRLQIEIRERFQSGDMQDLDELSGTA